MPKSGTPKRSGSSPHCFRNSVREPVVQERIIGEVVRVSGLSATFEVLPCAVMLSSSKWASVDCCLCSEVSCWHQRSWLPARPSIPNPEIWYTGGEMTQRMSHMSKTECLGVIPGPLVGIGQWVDTCRLFCPSWKGALYNLMVKNLLIMISLWVLKISYLPTSWMSSEGQQEKLGNWGFLCCCCSLFWDRVVLIL